MNSPDFSSSFSYGRLLNRLFGDANSTAEATANPIEQVPHSSGIGSSWEARTVTERSHTQSISRVTTLSTLKEGILTAKAPAGLLETNELLAATDSTDVVTGEAQTNDLTGAPLVLAATGSIPYPGYVLRYSPGTPLESRSGVAQWQTQMQQRGWSITVDGLYGAESDRIARQFQTEKGLLADGIVGMQTWRTAFDNSTITGVNELQPDPIEPIASNSYPGSTLSYSPLRPLSFDSQAQTFQQRLQDLGWQVEADGWFGPRSAAATRLFQQQHNLDADGIVGPQTWAVVFSDSALNAPAQQDLNPVAATNRINAAGLELIKSFEGLRLNSYLDAVGVWTIGYGHTRTAGPGQSVSFAGATALLREDVATFERAVTQAVRVPITANQYAALVSFAYNVGSGALNSSTLLRRLNAGDTFGAANELLRWNRAGGRVLAGLTRRREAERALFLS